MSKKQSDNIESRIKEAAENYSPVVTEDAWDKMQLLLDKEFAKKRRRPLLWFWPLLLLIGGGAGVYYYSKEPSRQTLRPNVTSVPGKDQKIPDNTTVAAGKKRQEAGVRENKNNTTQFPHSTVRPEEPITGELASTDKQAETKETAKAKTKAEVATGKTNRRTVAHNSTANRINTPNSKSNSGPERKQTVAAIGRTGDRKNQDSQVAAGKNEDAVVDPLPGKSVVTSDNKPNDVPATKIDQPAAANTNLTKSDTPTVTNPPVEKLAIKPDKPKSKSKFYFTASVASDANSVKTLAVNNVTAAYGVGVGYNLNSRLSIRTGFYAGKKVYTAKEDDYKYEPGSYWDVVNMQNIEADCFVYEIPVSLQYYFSQNKKSGFYGVGGISSYIMKKESYEYYYYHNSTTLKHASQTYKGNKHLMSVIALSVGYERKISKAFGVFAEPYIKLPLAGVGEGKVRLYSTGLQLGLKFQPTK